MDFENYANKILLINDCDFLKNQSATLPLSHPYLKELNECKEQKGQRIEKYFWQEKDKLLAMETKAQLMN